MHVRKRILEYRRKRACELAAAGWRVTDIAAALGASKAAVSQWLLRWKGGEPDCLDARSAPGAEPRLTPRHRQMIGVLLSEGPRAFGFDQPQWSRTTLGTMIERLFGVRYTPQHVGRLLHGKPVDTPAEPLLRIELDDILRSVDLDRLRDSIRSRTGSGRPVS